MKTLNKLILIALLVTSLSGFSQDCSILKNNHFKYQLNGKTVEVEFNEDKHIELHQNGKYYIKSNVEWVSDCEYYLIIQDVTLPDFPFQLGSKLHLKIIKVRGDRVYYKSTMGNRTWEGKMIKVDKKEKN